MPFGFECDLHKICSTFLYQLLFATGAYAKQAKGGKRTREKLVVRRVHLSRFLVEFDRCSKHPLGLLCVAVLLRTQALLQEDGAKRSESRPLHQPQ